MGILDRRNRSLVELGEGSGDLLHLLAINLAEGLEIRLDLLGDDAGRVGNELRFLHIDFAEDYSLYLLEMRPHLVGDDRDDEFGQRLGSTWKRFYSGSADEEGLRNYVSKLKEFYVNRKEVIEPIVRHACLNYEDYIENVYEKR